MNCPRKRFNIIAFLFAALLGASGVAQAQTVNRIVAVVNDDIVTEGDVDAFVQALHDDPNNSVPEEQTGDLRRVVLQRLIDQRLILQEARRAEVIVPSDDVLERYEAFRNRFDSIDLFHQSLRETGLTEEDLKRRTREQLTIQRTIEAKVRSTLSVSPQEVSAELAKHPELIKKGYRSRLSHLLIRISDRRNGSQAKDLATNLRTQIEAGASTFEAVAKRYSEDQFREDGGMMGWVAAGELMPELDSVMQTLDVGALSQPIQTKLGFHLIRIEERKSAESLSVTEANNAVYQKLYQDKFQKAFTRWMQELRKKAYIELPGYSG